MVEEFISTVSEIVPDLLNADQKAQLLLGLRARVRLSDIFMQRLAKTLKGNTGCKTATTSSLISLLELSKQRIKTCRCAFSW